MVVCVHIKDKEKIVELIISQSMLNKILQVLSKDYDYMSDKWHFNFIFREVLQLPFCKISFYLQGMGGLKQNLCGLHYTIQIKM